MKCAFHKGRGKCRMPDCHNQVYARQLCVRHGGKKICLRPHCTAHARGNAFCLKHGGVAKRRTCEVDGSQGYDVDFSILQVLAKEFTSKRVHIDGLEVWKDEDSSTQVPNVVET
ncbi:hypothetical protein DYB35_005749 [Aphanomyces astaci]|uniref:Uncharacterized protein n=1 Tax=Aphanomyces astaci TaxID=112090 RepID=A0A3R6WRH1_APHAT|nr:hypothetical protein DYB35_005749 [Aphanomyces astaci]